MQQKAHALLARACQGPCRLSAPLEMDEGGHEWAGATRAAVHIRKEQLRTSGHGWRLVEAASELWRQPAPTCNWKRQRGLLCRDRF